jgi:hypothetical protein
MSEDLKHDVTFHMIVDTIVEDLDMQHIFRGEL